MDVQRALGDCQGKTALEKCLLACATAVIYYALAAMGLTLAQGPSMSSPLWPAAGFALAAAFLWGPSASVGVFFASWLINISALIGGRHFGLASALIMSALVGLGSGLQAWAGSALLRRYGRYQEPHTSMSSAAAFCLLAPVTCLISASFSFIAHAVAGMPGIAAVRAALVWWIGDTVGILTVTPLILAWTRPQAPQPSPARAAERAAATVMLILCASLGFGIWGIPRIEGVPLLFITFPPMFWIILRFGPRAATAAVAALAAAIILKPDIHHSLLVSASYLAALSVTALIARGLLAQREDAMSRLSAEHQAAQKRLELNKKLFQGLPTGLVILRFGRPGKIDSLRILDVNPTGHLLAGDAAARTSGAPLTELFSSTAAGELAETSLAALQGGECRVLRDCQGFKRMPGAYFNLTLFALSDRDVGVAFEDVTERKKAQRVLYESSQLMHLMIESVHDYAIFRLDTRGHVASWSSGSQLIYGYRADEIIGRSYDVFFPTDADSPRKHLSDVGRDGRSKIETWCVRKDGARFWADIVLTPFNDASGGPLGYVCIVRDATRRRAAERLVEEQSAALSRSNVELSQFAYVASHDLREPLHKVKAFADRLQDRLEGKIDEEGRDYLRRMLRSVDSMQNLIDDLLELARVTTRGGVPQVVDLGALAKDVLESLDLTIERTRARVEIGDMPQIHADPLQMRQLLQNLISNSLKFHKPGAPPRVRVHGRATGDGRCVIVVSDDGIGFDMKYAERIFQPFQRLHGRHEFEGTGMGLAICQKIAARHGGAITASSGPGRGAEFTVTLPISQEGRSYLTKPDMLGLPSAGGMLWNKR